MKQLTILLSILFVNFAFGQKQARPADPLAGIDTLLQRVLKDRKGAGFAVAVVHKDKIIYAKGFGFRDYEKKLPVTPGTLFAIGSCTKAFTSSLLGLLNKENKLEYDKPAKTYLPELDFFNNEMNSLVTVRDMMCHRTGLPRHDLSWYFFSTDSRDSLLQRIKYQEPTAPVRQLFQYNNFMFLTQGMIAEKITGQSWETNIRERLFTPLEMKTSNLSIREMEKSSDVSLGYTVRKDSLIRKMPYYNINAMGPAGSINSSVNEMANWVITWINGGKFKGKEILPAAYIKEAMTSQMVMAPGLPDKEIPDAHLANYGFGWMISSYRGHYRVEHGGNIDGFSASTSFFPTDSIGIIVLVNQNASAIPGIVRNSIADKLLKLQPIDWNGRINDALKKAKEAEKTTKGNKKEGTKPSHENTDYTGLFNNPGYGTFEIINRNDSLIMLTPTDEIWLRHYHYDVFEALNIDKTDGIDTSSSDNLMIQFQMNTAGEINSILLPLQGGLKDIEFSRQAKAKDLSKDEMNKYTGDYEFAPGNTVRFYLKGDKTLFAFLEGQPEYELVALGNDKFSIKILSGYSVQFEKDANGEIITASFIQPNGTFKAKKKK
jgi:CubicO group peptidase (beta-lactamase class C family)